MARCSLKIVTRDPRTGRVRSVDYTPPSRIVWFAYGVWVSVAVVVLSLLLLPKLVNATEISTCFVPSEDCEALVIGEISRARSEILVQQYEFTSWPVVVALNVAQRRGVRLLVVLDRVSALKDQTKEILKSGADVRIDPASGIAHNKIYIIDRQEVITGSMNATYSGAHRNVENIIIINDRQVANRYVNNFVNRYNLSR